MCQKWNRAAERPIGYGCLALGDNPLMIGARTPRLTRDPRIAMALRLTHPLLERHLGKVPIRV